MVTGEYTEAATGCRYQYNTIQFIDLRRRNSLFVRLRDRDTGWMFKKPRRTDNILNDAQKYRINVSANLTKSGRLFQLVGAAAWKAEMQ